MRRVLAVAPVTSSAFVAILALAAFAVRNGLVADDMMRLWAGASTAADGGIAIGRIVAGYPTLPFLTSTLTAWLAPAGTPAPAVVSAALFACLAGFFFHSFRAADLPRLTAAVVTLLIAFHPALLRAVVAGPADMFLAVFLLMLCLALYDLRARGGTSQVMAVGLALMGLAFSHPLGAAIAFAATPFLAFAVRPVLVANSAFNVVIALVFPTFFMMGAFSYVSWVFPGDGWSFFAAPAESLSLWSAAMAPMLGNGLSGVLPLDASLALTVALALGAPVAVVALARVHRRRPLVVPAGVFVATVVAASAISIVSGLFGEPSGILVATPVLAATVVIRIPVARERTALLVVLLLLGWFGGLVSLAVLDPITVARIRTAVDGGGSERLDAVAAGGAARGRDGILADTDNAPALVLGHGGSRGFLVPRSEPFALAILFKRLDAPDVAVPDPQSATGRDDRLNRAFPSLFHDGLPGYRVVYQNKTWRLLERSKQKTVETKK